MVFNNRWLSAKITTFFLSCRLFCVLLINVIVHCLGHRRLIAQALIENNIEKFKSKQVYTWQDHILSLWSRHNVKIHICCPRGCICRSMIPSGNVASPRRLEGTRPDQSLCIILDCWSSKISASPRNGKTKKLRTLQKKCILHHCLTIVLIICAF